MAKNDTLPYPEYRGQADVRSADIISPAYAGLESELTAISQYIYHSIRFEGAGDAEHAEDLEQIAIAEMHHFKLLGKTLLALGVDPVLSVRPPRRCNWFNTSSISYSYDPVSMILDDMRGERDAIAMYEGMIRRLTNPDVAALIRRIVMDEREHLERLSEIYRFLVNAGSNRDR